jgi:uncharacterized protein
MPEAKHPEARQWIEHLQLLPHPEGGYFRETYRSVDSIPLSVLPERFGSDRQSLYRQAPDQQTSELRTFESESALPYRSCCTGIYFLLESHQFSALHRIKSDEMWHFYAGSGLTVYQIRPTGQVAKLRLGKDIGGGETFQGVVEAGCWFGAVVEKPDSYALVGCTVAPGFDFHDFEMAEREQLLQTYPQHRQLIERLTSTPS